MTKKTITSLVGVMLVLVAAALTGGSGAADFLTSGSSEWIWKPTNSLKQGRLAHTATLLADDKTVLVAAGCTSGYELRQTSEIFNGKQWAPTQGPLNDGRYNHTATLLKDGTVLAAGGRAGVAGKTPPEDYDLNTSEIFSFNAGTWAKTSGLLTDARSSHTATLLSGDPQINGKVLVVGGQQLEKGKTMPVVLASCELYDPDSGKWATKTSLTIARYGHTATTLGDGRVMVIGGFNASGNAIKSCEIYDPVGDTWSNAPSLHTARGAHTTTVLANGKVLVVGGSTAPPQYGGNPMDICEILDLKMAKPIWDDVAPLLNARAGHAAGLLTQDPYNGQVLVAGGAGAPTSAELYDPDTDFWRNTANNLPSPGHSFHTGTLLKDGRFLVVGGIDPSYAGTNSADFFQPRQALLSPRRVGAPVKKPMPGK